MKTSATKQNPVFAVDVTVTAEALTVELSDGRRLSAPLSWFPRLVHGSDTGAQSRGEHYMFESICYFNHIWSSRIEVLIEQMREQIQNIE